MDALDLRRHKQSLLRNPQKWAELDFEAVSDELGIEINCNMSPAVVRAVIEGRFNEMSMADYNRIDIDILEYLSVLNALGKFEIQYNLTSTTPTIYPFKLLKEDKNVVTLSPVGATFSRFEELIDTNIGLNTYLEESGARIQFCGDRVSIYCNDFYPWTEKQLVEIFKSFDAYAEM